MVFNPSMFGLTAEQMAAGKEVGNHLRMELRVHHREGRVEIKYTLINPEDAKLFNMSQAVDKMNNFTEITHETMFGMQGKIIDVD